MLSLQLYLERMSCISCNSLLCILLPQISAADKKVAAAAAAMLMKHPDGGDSSLARDDAEEIGNEGVDKDLEGQEGLCYFNKSMGVGCLSIALVAERGVVEPQGKPMRMYSPCNM